MTTNKTDSKMFTCKATSAVTFQTKVFFSLVSCGANQKAKAWLAEQDKKAA